MHNRAAQERNRRRVDRSRLTSSHRFAPRSKFGLSPSSSTLRTPCSYRPAATLLQIGMAGNGFGR